jgi:hypothetical protein
MTGPLSCRRRHRVYPNDLSATRILFEGHVTVTKRKKRMVGAHADISARVELSSALAHENVAGENRLAAKPLYTEALTRRVATVSR